MCQTLSFALAQLHSRIFFLRLETKPKPGIRLELEMYFPPNAQMSAQSKSAPRHLTRLTRQRNHEQQSHMDSDWRLLPLKPPA